MAVFDDIAESKRVQGQSGLEPAGDSSADIPGVEYWRFVSQARFWSWRMMQLLSVTWTPGSNTGTKRLKNYTAGSEARPMGKSSMNCSGPDSRYRCAK